MEPKVITTCELEDDFALQNLQLAEPLWSYINFCRENNSLAANPPGLVAYFSFQRVVDLSCEG